MLFHMHCLVLGFFLSLVFRPLESVKGKSSENSNEIEYRFKKVIIFGDSNSDTGNLYKLTDRKWPLSPPYYRGRFCNYLNWVDQLQGPRAMSYAYGSATTDNNFVPGYEQFNDILVPGIRQQVQSYLEQDSSSEKDISKNLYILWGGANDFLVNSTLAPPRVVTSLLNSATDLLKKGAKHILVVNLVPAQYIPVTKSLAPVPVLIGLTGLFNQALTTSLLAIKQTYSTASLNIFDINALITKVVNSKSGYFKNTTSNCWYSYNATTVLNLCGNPDRYVFLDLFHFTYRVQQLIAMAISPFFLSSYEVNSASCYINST